MKATHLKTGSNYRLLLVALFCSALLPWLNISFLQGYPSFAAPIIDSAEYVKEAKGILGLEPVPPEPLLHSPLYSYVMAGVFFLFGVNIDLVRTLQILLNVLSCFCVYYIGIRLFCKKSAITAAFIWAFYGPVIFYSGEILNVTLALTLQLSSFALIIRARQNNNAFITLLAGLLSGLTVITRGDILLFYLFLSLVAFIPFSTNNNRPKNIIRLILFVMGLVVPLLGVGVRNYVVSGTPALLPANSGIVFYSGNNKEYKKYIGVRPGFIYTEMAFDEPQSEAKGTDREFGYKNYFYKKSFDFVMSEPMNYLKALIYKIRTLANGYELPETVDLYTYRAYSPVLSALLFEIKDFYFPYSVIWAFALMGIAVNRKNWNKQFLLLFFLFCMLVPLLGFWNSSRYRMPIVPVLILYSASFLVQLPFLQLKTIKQKVIAFFLLVTVVFSNIPVAHFSHGFDFLAEAYSLVSVENIRVDKVDEALENLKISLALQLQDTASTNDPILIQYKTALLAGTYNRLGVTHKVQGNLIKAKRNYLKASSVYPNSPLINSNIGSVFLAENNYDEAIRYYTKALNTHKNYHHAHFGIARAYMKIEKDEKAIFHLKKVVEIKPRHEEAFFYLGRIMQGNKNHEEAEKYFLSALHINEENKWVHNSLGQLFLEMDLKDKARQEFTKALDIDSAYAPASNNLALLHAFEGNIDLAEETWLTITRTSPDFYQSYVSLGNIWLLVRKDPAQARSFYEKAIAIQPDLTEVHFNLGGIYNRLGETRKAVHHFLQILKKEPYNEVACQEVIFLFSTGKSRGKFTQWVNQDQQKQLEKTCFKDRLEFLQ